jgi:hypothetical protein
VIPTIILSVIVMALFPVGYILGQRSANDAIQRERDLVIDLQAQNDGLQSRMLTMLDETIKGGQK